MSVIQPVTMVPIGVIHSCFTEKFGIPRQPGMVREATAELEMLPPFNRAEMVRGLAYFSHVWVHFIFHDTIAEGWKPTVRPPWLGGRKRVGVFASRSPHRPNHLGLSAVRLSGIRTGTTGVVLDLAGVDLLDGTPVVDIKPYISYSDRIEDAVCGYAQGAIPEVEIIFSNEADAFCRDYTLQTGRRLKLLIEEMVRNDPRPASQKARRTSFGMLLWDVDIHWRVEGLKFFIESISSHEE